MYILTIYSLPDDLYVILQQAGPDEKLLKRVALDWANQTFHWEVEDDTNVDEAFEDLMSYIDGCEADDPRILLRRADV